MPTHSVALNVLILFLAFASFVTGSIRFFRRHRPEAAAVFAMLSGVSLTLAIAAPWLTRPRIPALPSPFPEAHSRSVTAPLVEGLRAEIDLHNALAAVANRFDANPRDPAAFEPLFDLLYSQHPSNALFIDLQAVRVRYQAALPPVLP